MTAWVWIAALSLGVAAPSPAPAREPATLQEALQQAPSRPRGFGADVLSSCLDPRVWGGALAGGVAGAAVLGGGVAATSWALLQQDDCPGNCEGPAGLLLLSPVVGAGGLVLGSVSGLFLGSLFAHVDDDGGAAGGGP